MKRGFKFSFGAEFKCVCEVFAIMSKTPKCFLYHHCELSKSKS